jgi:hypothetical protein
MRPFISAVIIVVLSLAAAHSRERYPGQYAEVDPAERQWFNGQKVPGTQESCCSQADGTTAEEKIEGNHYWARFMYQEWNRDTKKYDDKDSGWLMVPDEAILDNNHHGAPVVYWFIPNGQVMIRCYARGTGI